MPERDEDTGKFAETISSERILQEGFSKDDPAKSTSEIVEHFNIPDSTARYKLEELAEQGEIKKKPLGGYKGVVWIRPCDDF